MTFVCDISWSRACSNPFHGDERGVLNAFLPHHENGGGGGGAGGASGACDRFRAVLRLLHQRLSTLVFV